MLDADQPDEEYEYELEDHRTDEEPVTEEEAKLDHDCEDDADAGDEEDRHGALSDAEPLDHERDTSGTCQYRLQGRARARGKHTRCRDEAGAGAGFRAGARAGARARAKAGTRRMGRGRTTCAVTAAHGIGGLGTVRGRTGTVMARAAPVAGTRGRVCFRAGAGAGAGASGRSGAGKVARWKTEIGRGVAAVGVISSRVSRGGEAEGAGGRLVAAISLTVGASRAVVGASAFVAGVIVGVVIVTVVAVVAVAGGSAADVAGTSDVGRTGNGKGVAAGRQRGAEGHGGPRDTHAWAGPACWAGGAKERQGRERRSWPRGGQQWRW